MGRPSLLLFDLSPPIQPKIPKSFEFGGENPESPEKPYIKRTDPEGDKRESMMDAALPENLCSPCVIVGDRAHDELRPISERRSDNKHKKF